MANKYIFLEKFINKDTENDNRFIPISAKHIKEAEDRLGFNFPVQLREFYKEIGAGVFRRSYMGEGEVRSHINRLLDPHSIADILLLGYGSGQLHPDVEFQEGEMPFFEVGEGDTFLIMQPNSASPNAVYGMLGELIEPNFEQFIWRLYYESPTYYMDKWGN